MESRRLYPWLWHHLYETNLLTNVNWGNMAGHQNWLMNSSGLALVPQSIVPWCILQLSASKVMGLRACSCSVSSTSDHLFDCVARMACVGHSITGAELA